MFSISNNLIDHTIKAEENVEKLLKTKIRISTQQIPQYFNSLFGDEIRLGWIHHLHRRLNDENKDLNAWKDLQKLDKILGPEGKLAKTIFLDLSTNLTLEKRQLPLSIAYIFSQKQRSTLLNDYQSIFSKGKGTFDFRNQRINVSMQQWFLFVLVHAAISQPYVVTTKISQSIDDFYHNLITNPYLYLIRKYIIFFDKTGSVNKSKLLLILQQHCIQDYILSLQNKTLSPPIRKQVVLDIIYLLIYFDRESLNQEDMTTFFVHFLDSQKRGSQAFNACSLTRLWLYFIRPFDTVESTVINLVLETDQQTSSKRKWFLSLKRYKPQSILSCPTLNSQYYKIIKNSLENNIQILHLSISSILVNREISAKSIYILSLISYLFNPNYDSSIIRIIQTSTHKQYNFFKNKYYLEAKEILTRTIINLEAGKIQQYFSKDKDIINNIYRENHRQIGQFLALYEIQNYIQQQNIKHQEIYEKQQQQISQSPWEQEICSHEIRIVYYLALLIANLYDFAMYNRPFSLNPKTNLRPICNISIVVIIVSIALVLIYSLS